jgi:drug/metabolite transporter (DMT)-like permease
MGGVWILSREVLGRMDLEVVQASVSSPNESFTASKVSNKSSLFGVLYALGAALSFGIGHFLRKLGLMEVPSPFWGMAIGTIIAWSAVVVHATTKGEIKKLCHNNFNFHNPPWFFILAGLLFTLGQMLSFMAIYFTAVSIVVILASSEPLITLIISRLILRGEEPLNWRVIISSGGVFFGVIFMIF